MNNNRRMLWYRRAFAFVVSFACILPGSASPATSERGPNPEGCCDETGCFFIRFTVKFDPANHQAVIQLRDGRIVTVRLSDGSYEISGDRPVIIRATAAFSPSVCGFPSANGSGTVAGFPNVTGRYKDVAVSGNDITGLLELGVGGELPTGQPICYTFIGTRDPDVPDSGAALVNYAVAYTLQFVAAGELVRRPRGITIRFGDESTVGLHWGLFAMLKDGTGGLVPVGTTPIPEGHVPVASVALERLDSDTISDIAVLTQDAIAGTAAVSVFAQRSAGRFDWTQTLTLAQEYSADDVFIAAGDLTGDGGSEIVTASESGRVDVFDNNGGTFSSGQTLDLGAQIAGMLPDILDFDGDITRDVALFTADLDRQTLSVNTLRGDGSGRLTPGPTTQLPDCYDATFFGRFGYAAVDLDTNGLIDLVFGGQGGECPTPAGRPIVNSLLNRSDEPGAFAPAPSFEVPEGTETFQLSLFTPRCAATPALIANGGIFVGTGDGGFVDTSVRIQLDGHTPVSALPFDADGNGFVDVTAVFAQDDLFTIQTFSLTELATRPLVSNVSVAGKTLVVEGSGFTTGSQILVNGVAYKTKADRATPESLLTSKKALKKIPSGASVTVQVRTPDGVVSNGVVFSRP